MISRSRVVVLSMILYDNPLKFYPAREFPVNKMTHTCPVCGKKEHLVRDDDLGDEGMFYCCHEHRGGCGSTFRVTPNGECVDIF